MFVGSETSISRYYHRRKHIFSITYLFIVPTEVIQTIKYNFTFTIRLQLNDTKKYIFDS